MQGLKKNILSGFYGAMIGTCNGLLGGGGGMIAVPLLKNALNFSSKRAHATAILLILPLSIASAIIYIVRGFALPQVFIPVALGGVTGGFFGAKLLQHLPVKAVNLTFTFAMLVAGVRMVL